MENSTPLSTTVFGYTVIVGAAAAYWGLPYARSWYNNRNSRSRPPQESGPGRAGRRDGLTTLDRGNSKEKINKQSKPKKAQPSANRFEGLHVEGSNDTEEESADMSWAHQLANARKGTNLTRKEQDETRNRSVKQSKANQTPEESVSGADADDDLSPAMSPSLKAQGAPSGKAVTDMLESQGAAPSILRVAPKEERPNAIQESGWNLAGKRDKVKQHEPISNSAEAETKKQRQNRQKVEERKAQREEDERLRRIQLENQRRTAREARGEAAKNGLGVSTAPAANSWSKGAANGASISSKISATGSTAATDGSGNGRMLDTFDTSSTASSQNDNLVSGNTQASPASQSTANTWHEHDLPSEEEQMRMLQEQDESSWNTVQDKRKMKRQKSEVRARAAAEAEMAALAEYGKENSAAPAVQPAQAESKGHPQDSEWAVV